MSLKLRWEKSPPCHINKALKINPIQNPIHIGHLTNLPSVVLNFETFSRIGLNMYDTFIINVAPIQDNKKRNSSMFFNVTAGAYPASLTYRRSNE